MTDKKFLVHQYIINIDVEQVQQGKSGSSFNNGKSGKYQNKKTSCKLYGALGQDLG